MANIICSVLKESTHFFSPASVFVPKHSTQQTMPLSLYLQKQYSYPVLLEDEKIMKKSKYVLSRTDSGIFPGVLTCYSVWDGPQRTSGTTTENSKFSFLYSHMISFIILTRTSLVCHYSHLWAKWVFENLCGTFLNQFCWQQSWLSCWYLAKSWIMLLCFSPTYLKFFLSSTSATR